MPEDRGAARGAGAARLPRDIDAPLTVALAGGDDVGAARARVPLAEDGGDGARGVDEGESDGVGAEPAVAAAVVGVDVEGFAADVRVTARFADLEGWWDIGGSEVGECHGRCAGLVRADGETAEEELDEPERWSMCEDSHLSHGNVPV